MLKWAEVIWVLLWVLTQCATAGALQPWQMLALSPYFSSLGEVLKNNCFPDHPGCRSWPWGDILQTTWLLFLSVTVCEARIAIHDRTFGFPREGGLEMKIFLSHSALAFDAFVFEYLKISPKHPGFQSRIEPSIYEKASPVLCFKLSSQRQVVCSHFWKTSFILENKCLKNGVQLLVTRKFLGIKVVKKKTRNR